MARCIGARAEVRTYSARPAIPQVSPDLLVEAEGESWKNWAMGIGVFHVEHDAGHHRPASEPRFVQRWTLRLAPYLSPLAHRQHRCA